MAVGQAVNITVAGLPNRVFRSRIELIDIDSVVDPATQRVAVRASLANSSQELKPGSFATVQIFDDRQTRNAVMIPQSTIVEPVDQPPLVFVQNGTAFEAVEVTLGQRVGDQVEVISGLYGGDRIVTQGTMQLYAQSLRGDTSTATSDTKPETDSPPWIWLGAAVGAIALFGAGLGWQAYRTQRLNSAAHTEPSQSFTPTKVNP